MALIIECGFARNATLHFLVRGNTKNFCFQYYNTLSNLFMTRLTYIIYNEKELDEALLKSSFVILYYMIPTQFNNFDKWQNEVYTGPLDSIMKYLLGPVAPFNEFLEIPFMWIHIPSICVSMQHYGRNQAHTPYPSLVLSLHDLFQFNTFFM